MLPIGFNRNPGLRVQTQPPFPHLSPSSNSMAFNCNPRSRLSPSLPTHLLHILEACAGRTMCSKSKETMPSPTEDKLRQTLPPSLGKPSPGDRHGKSPRFLWLTAAWQGSLTVVTCRSCRLASRIAYRGWEEPRLKERRRGKS